MDISALQAFIAVARYRSFSMASDSLFVTQPAISKRVAALEYELGTQLFNRIARQISLTDAGKQLLPKAQEVVNQAEDLQRYASNLKHRIQQNSFDSISRRKSTDKTHLILRALEIIASNLEEITHLSRNCTEHSSHIIDFSALYSKPFSSIIMGIRKGTKLILPAIEQNILCWWLPCR